MSANSFRGLSAMALGDSYRALADDFTRRAKEEADPAKQKELERLARE